MFKRKKRYPDSPYYRTGDVRVVPGFMGFMQAQELWRKDSYNQYHGICSGFTTKWKSVGKLPQSVDDNFYAYLQPYEKEDSFSRKWRLLITYLPGGGIKDPVPQSPEENAKFHRRLKREREKELEASDNRESDD